MSVSAWVKKHYDEKGPALWLAFLFYVVLAIDKVEAGDFLSQISLSA